MAIGGWMEGARNKSMWSEFADQSGMSCSGRYLRRQASRSSSLDAATGPNLVPSHMRISKPCIARLEMSVGCDERKPKVTEYRHDFSTCERMGLRIGVLLARGAFEAAADSLSDAIESLSGDKFDTVGDIPLSHFLDVRHANGFEREFGILYVKDLRGYIATDFLVREGFGPSVVKSLKLRLKDLGVPFPVPEGHVFSEGE